MKNEHIKPEFQVIRLGEANARFFTASAAPVAANPTASLGSMTTTDGGWM